MGWARVVARSAVLVLEVAVVVVAVVVVACVAMVYWAATGPSIFWRSE